MVQDRARAAAAPEPEGEPVEHREGTNTAGMIHHLIRLLALLATASLSSAFVVPSGPQHQPAVCRTTIFSSTTVAPPETETTRKKRREDNIIPAGEGDVRGPVEWYAPTLCGTPLLALAPPFVSRCTSFFYRCTAGSSTILSFHEK